MSRCFWWFRITPYFGVQTKCYGPLTRSHVTAHWHELNEPVKHKQHLVLTPNRIRMSVCRTSDSCEPHQSIRTPHEHRWTVLKRALKHASGRHISQDAPTPLRCFVFPGVEADRSDARQPRGMSKKLKLQHVQVCK